MTAADLAYIEGALGPEIANVATELVHRPTRRGWRELVQLLYRDHLDVMASSVGQRFLLEALVRMADSADADETGRYEGIELDGGDRDKLVALADRLLFYCRIARLRTRPVRIAEAEGCIRIWWSRYAPRAFRGRLLNLVSNGRVLDTLTVQKSQSVA